jgi:CRISPR-associated protein Cas2
MKTKYCLICYDIEDNKRRTKLSDLLSGYGVRVNYSVFEIIISPVKFKKLLSQINQIADKKDNIRIYILDKESIQKSFILNSDKEVFSLDELYF